MLALLAEKAWILRELDQNRERLHRLTHRRSGFFIIGERFCATRLGVLLQEIARARLEQLRLLSFVEYIEQRLRALTRRHATSNIAPQGEIILGGCTGASRKRAVSAAAALFLSLYAVRYLTLLRVPRPL